METKKTNTEQVVLGLGVIAGVALIVLAVMGVLGLEKKFEQSSASKKALKEIDGVVRVDAVNELLNVAPQWEVNEVEGRNVELMTSVPLFRIPGVRYLVDLYKEDGEPVHPPIPNRWWLKYNIDPSYKNSLIRDFDEDGFSNIEEFEANTDPTDFKSVPALIDKLELVSYSTLKWKLTFSSDIGNDQYQFRYEDQKRRTLRSDYIGRGSSFFSEEPAAGRFVLTDVEEREVEKSGFTSKVKYAIIQDTLKNKSFEIGRGNKNSLLTKDYTVTFSLKAIGMDSETFAIPENSKFDLPSGKVSPEGKFHFIEVKDGKNAIIQYLVGDKVTKINLPLN